MQNFSSITARMIVPYANFMYFTIFLSYINSNCLLGYASEFKNETDRMALLAFKEAIIWDVNGVFNSWNNSLHYCHWKGISCSTKHPQRVTGLRLISQGLVGSLSPHIGNLSFLRFIILQNNTFNGEIPPELGKLFRLRTLHLSNNSFHGEVPPNLTSCKNLREINFVDNDLSGKIPVELSSLQSLISLALSINNFRGQLPPFLGNLSSLIQLSLAEANLEGSIPKDIGRLTRLQYLVLFGNNLTGTIPSTIYNLSSLKHISLTGNRLEGNLPAYIGFTLPNLQHIYFGGNLFTGLIPSSLSNASQLQTIFLPGNRFKGPIPEELGMLVNLSWIGLEGNMLGTSCGNDLSFITNLTNCTKLDRLLLATNHLKGPIPESIANLSTQLRLLTLHDNLIYGAIPPGIGNLVKLNMLDMGFMMLSGNIPSDIGKLKNLFALYIPENELIGQIPTTLGNLTALSHLALSGNNLSGNIPNTLGNCRKLLIINLGQNNLQGFVPVSIFDLLSVYAMGLHRNSLSGSLPPDIGKLKQLQILDVSGNKLSGGIPNELGSCLSLEYLYLNSNSFAATIPQRLSSLTGLRKLDLSHNNLSGVIPNYLGVFQLQELNLSFNNFEGEVPKTGIFKNISGVSLLGNSKLCGGIPVLKLPACIIQHSKKRRRLLLALKVIPPLIVVVICLVLFFLFRYRRKKSKDTSPAALFKNQFIKISYQELLQATDGFSETNLIGFGSYGSVYRGFLHQSRSFIAVKVFKRGASKSFISECKALRNIRHRNLIKIISVCSSVDYQGNDFRAVIYGFMAGGSLERWLYPEEFADNETELKTLNLEQRLNIAIDVATAVDYLHCHCQPPIAHGDLKPSNILLNEEMVAHVGDFGLAKVLSQEDQSSTIILKGSVGYVPPEYGMGGGASIQGDVYSFGILLLEIFAAKRPTDDMFQGNLNLHNFIGKALSEQLLMDALDPKLLLEENKAGRVHDCLAAVLSVGLSCSMETPTDRMEISNVLRELYLIKNAYT